MDYDVTALAAQMQQLTLEWGLKILGAVAVYFVGWLIARTVRRALHRLFRKTDFDETLEVFLTSLAYWMVLAFTLVAVLGAFGIQTTSIIAVLASAGLAIGLAMQGTLSNFAAGFMILIFRPFKLGDFIEAGGVSGSVCDVGLFSTGLNTSDNVRIMVPNGRIFGETIKNYSVNETRRIDMVLGISYDDDITKALEVIDRVLGDEPRLLPDPASIVAVSELADSSVNIVVRPWCRRSDYWTVRCDLTRSFKEALEAAGCSIPYPQTEVHLRSVGEAA
ncbi:MAG: mechanosensitive ion channel domain-containing protein [Acidobacteriota bacterium]|nr:mechanosensitive ion channel domain-containing protein [Acidobacteriota bacterium]